MNTVIPYVSISNSGSSMQYLICGLNLVKPPDSTLFKLFFIKAQDHFCFEACIAFQPLIRVILTFRLYFQSLYG